MNRDCAFCGRLFASRTEAAACEREHASTDPNCRWPGKPTGMATMKPTAHPSDKETAP